MLQNDSLGAMVTEERGLILPSISIFEGKRNQMSAFLSRVPKDKSSPLALARADLVFKEYCKIGIYEKEDCDKVSEIYEEYKNNSKSSSYLLFNLNHGAIDGKVTATYAIDGFQNLPSYVNGYWREEDIEHIVRRKGSEIERKVAEISKFASNPNAGQNSSTGLFRIYGKIFSEIKKQTDNIFISACENDLKHYVGMKLGEAFMETKHNSDELNGNEVVAGYIGLSDMENSEIHGRLKRMAIKETPAKEIEDWGKSYISFLMSGGNPLWNCI